MPEDMNRKEAIKFLGIPKKNFDNYFKFSKEIKGFKRGSRWYFKKSELEKWKKLKEDRTVILSLEEYEKCFEFAIKIVYSSKPRGGGIRGARSEMQATDDWILGILAEHGVKRFLKEKFNFEIGLDTEVHPEHITPQDIVSVIKNGKEKEPEINVSVKASKVKNCYLVLSEIEYENENRKSDVYIFVRVDLSSDHLFRILREHSFFKRAKEFLENNDKFRKIEKLENVEVWICGFIFHDDLEKATEIPGQKFGEGYRYVKNVAKLKNSDDDWKKFIEML